MRRELKDAQRLSGPVAAMCAMPTGSCHETVSERMRASALSRYTIWPVEPEPALRTQVGLGSDNAAANQTQVKGVRAQAVKSKHQRTSPQVSGLALANFSKGLRNAHIPQNALGDPQESSSHKTPGTRMNATQVPWSGPGSLLQDVALGGLGAEL